MKKPFCSRIRLSAVLSATLLLPLTAPSAFAANRYWSANGTDGGGNGTWNTSTANRWGTAVNGPYTLAWVNGVDVAILGSAAGATSLTLGTNITCGGITTQANNTGSGNINEGASLFTLTLGITGNNAFSGFQSTTAGRPLHINAVIVGASGANLVLTGPSTTGGQVAEMSLNRANIFSGTTSFAGHSSGAANLTIGNQLALQNSTLTLSTSCGSLRFNSSVAANAFTFGGLAGAGRNIALQNNAGTPAAIALSVGNNNANTSYAAALTGAGSLLKIGSGTLTLTGNNTFSGTTTISSGKLQGGVGGGSVNSKVIIDNTLATLGVSITDNTKTWTCMELEPTAAGKIEFNFGAVQPSNSVRPLTITGLANFATATPTVKVVASAPLVPGIYPLMIWGSISGAAPSTPGLEITTGAGTAASLAVSGNILNLEITSTVPSVVKKDNAIELSNGLSWTNDVGPNTSEVGKWNSTVNSPNTTDLGADLTWAGIAIENPNGLVTINGTHTLTLGAATVDIDMGAATADLTLNCPLALDADHSWSVAASRTLTLGGQVSGAFGVTKVGIGTAVLSSGANSYTGDTSVTTGVLKLGASNVIPDGTGNGNVSVSATLDLNGNSETINNLSGAGIVDNLAAVTNSTLTVNSINPTSTFNGSLRDTASTATLNLIKTGAGTQTFSGANTLSGAVSITGGTLVVSNIAAFPNISGISMGDTTAIRADVADAVIGAPISVGAAGTTSTIQTPNVAGSGTTAVEFNLNGAISGDADLTFKGIQSNNAYSTIILRGASIYTGSTRFTCSDELAAPGTEGNQNIFVRLGATNALPVTTVLTLDGGDGVGTSPGRYCELNLNGRNQTLAGLKNVTGRALRVQRVVNSGADATLTVDNADNHAYSGQLGWVSGFGSAPYNNFNVTKNGVGIQTFSGARRYDGNTTVNGGTLSLGSANPNDELSTVTIAAARATLNLAYAGTDTVDKLFIGGIQLAAGVYGPSAINRPEIIGTGTLTVTSSPPGQNFASWIAGANFTNGPIPVDKRGPNVDFDNDGISNLVEFAIAGQDPTVANPSTGTFTLGTLSFSKRPGTSGLTYAIQQSTDLGNGDDWTQVTPPNYVNDANTISYALTLGTPVKNFLRLQVISN